jgi:hypothetical protein
VSTNSFYFVFGATGSRAHSGAFWVKAIFEDILALEREVPQSLQGFRF